MMTTDLAAAPVGGRWMDYETPLFRSLSRALDGTGPTATVAAVLPVREHVTCSGDGCGRRLVLGVETFGQARECLDCYLGIRWNGGAA